MNDFFIGEHPVEIPVHGALDNLRKLFRFHHIGAPINGHLLCNQFFQQLDCQVLLLHVGDFFEELRVEQRKFCTNGGKQIDNTLAFDAVFQQFIDPLVDLRQGELLPGAVGCQTNEHRPHRLKIGRFETDLRVHHAAAQGKGLLEQKRLFDIDGLCFFGIGQIMLSH